MLFPSRVLQRHFIMGGLPFNNWNLCVVLVIRKYVLNLSDRGTRESPQRPRSQKPPGTLPQHPPNSLLPCKACKVLWSVPVDWSVYVDHKVHLDHCLVNQCVNVWTSAVNVLFKINIIKSSHAGCIYMSNMHGTSQDFRVWIPYSFIDYTISYNLPTL